MKTLALLLLFFLLLLQYRLWLGTGSIPEVWKLREEIEVQQQENGTLEERNRTLEAEVRDLKQGVDAVEERARSELGMIKNGETFFQVVEE